MLSLSQEVPLLDIIAELGIVPGVTLDKVITLFGQCTKTCLDKVSEIEDHDHNLHRDGSSWLELMEERFSLRCWVTVLLKMMVFLVKILWRCF